MNTFASSRFRRSHDASIVAACALALCAGIAHAQFTTTWTGGAASGDWSTDGNWNNGAPTTSGTWALTFAGTTQTTSTNTIGSTSDTITLSSLLFSNTTVGMTLNRLDSRTLTLATNATVTTTAASAAITNKVIIPLTLLGTSTFSVATNANLDLDAASALTGGTLVKTGAGLLNFNGGGTNTTDLRITGGSISFNSASAMSAFNGRTLTVGSGASDIRFATGTTSVQFAFEAGTTVRGFGGNSPVFSSGTFNTATTASADVTVIIGQSAGTGAEIRGVIQDNLGGRKVGLRAWRSSNPTSVVLTAANTYTGATQMTGAVVLQLGNGGTTGSLSPSSPISGDAGSTLAFNRSNTVTQGTDFNSTLGGSFNVSQLGSGTLVFNAATTYTGTTSINAGTLRIGSGGTGGSLSTSSAITGSAGGTLAFNRSNTVTQGTDFNSVIGGAINVAQLGSGTLSLGGVNTHTGTTSVSNGTLALANVLAVQNSTLDTGTVGSQAVTFAVAGTNTYTLGGLQGSNGLAIGANTILVGGNNRSTTFSGVITGESGGLAKTGTGGITLSGSNTYTGTTSINAGTLQVGASGTAGSLSTSSVITGSAGGTLAFNRSDTVTQGTDFNSVIGGAINVSQLGSGTLALNGANTYTGTTSISNGTLQIGDAGVLGSGSYAAPISIASGGLLSVASSANQVLSGVISGAGGLTKNGTGVLTLSGANTYSGLTTVSAGVLATTADNRIPSGSSIVMSNGTLQLGGNNTVNAISGTAGTIDVGISRLTSSLTTSSTFSGSLVGNRPASAGQGPSGFQKSGSGTLTLTGNVSLAVDNSIAQGFNNPLQVNAGELVLAGTTTLTNVEVRYASSGNPTLRITSGSHSFNAGAGSSVGSVNVQNGSFIVDNGFAAVRGMSVGFGGVAGATNVLTINGGTLSSPAANIVLGNNADATQAPTLNLNGGVLETTGITNGGSSTNSITFNGGTLRMLGTSMIPSGTNTAGNFLALNVGNGGALLDTGTFANTISQGFVGVGSGGLTKLGSAQLTLAGTSTYTGATTISAGTLAFSSTSGLQGTSGVSIAGGAGLTYTGGATSFGKNVTVTSGTGTVRNSGGGTLTLAGTLTKDGTVLRLTGGAFNVTGQIVGLSPNSDLLVDGTSTVTLSTVNTYNGPTFVNQSSNLIMGIDDAIPSGSIVTLGDATTAGTLTLGSFSDAIGGLAFGAGGGTLRMTASSTTAAQLSSASGTFALSGGTLDLTGSGTTAGLYRLLSAQSITGAFSGTAGLSAAYQLLSTGSTVDLQQRAVLGNVSVTNPSVSIITGGSAAFTYTVANNALAGGAGMAFTGAGLVNVAGSTLGSVDAAGTSDAVSGLIFTGTSIGSGQQGTFTVTAPSAFGSTTATGTVSVNVLNHSLASFQASDTATLSLHLGAYDTNSSTWTSGSGSLGFSLWNIASGGYTDADTAGLDLYDVVFTSGTDVFSTSLTNFSNLVAGTFNGYTASVLSPGSLAEGVYQGVYTLRFRDQQNLSGAANTRDLTLTANVIVVPEPGAILLAGIGAAAAAWTLRYKK